VGENFRSLIAISQQVAMHKIVPTFNRGVLNPQHSKKVVFTNFVKKKEKLKAKNKINRIARHETKRI
jgi:hypothetical protein